MEETSNFVDATCGGNKITQSSDDLILYRESSTFCEDEPGMLVIHDCIDDLSHSDITETTNGMNTVEVRDLQTNEWGGFSCPSYFSKHFYQVFCCGLGPPI